MKTIIAFIKDKDYRRLLYSSLSMIALGSTVYHFIEGWSWIDSVYFSFVALTTVGFGDITPQTDLGKIFTIFYLIIGIGLILSFVDILFNHYSKTGNKNKRS